MCLGHMCENDMAELSRRGLLEGQKTSKLQFYEHCVFGKHKRVRFSSGIYKSKGLLDYYIQTFGDLQNYLLWEVLLIC